MAKRCRHLDDGMVMMPSPKTWRNPGPAWGYAFLLWADRWWPKWFFRPVSMLGTWIGVAAMPGQRAHSRDYLSVVLARPPTAVEVWRHFQAFTDFLMLSLRVGRGEALKYQLETAHAAGFEKLFASPQPALFGTFHFGSSDLLGYLLGTRGRRVSIIRLRVENSADTRLLGERFGGSVSFLWINDPASLVFDLKAALDAGNSLALKCDRLDFSAKAEPFRFLGAKRTFPFTIYHLSILFGLPVVFCTALTDESGTLRITSSPVFLPDSAATRDSNLNVARAHFQGVLDELERQLRLHPYQWFNFLPLNPVVASDQAKSSR